MKHLSFLQLAAVAVSFLLLGLAAAPGHADSETKGIKPFSSDGCSLFPDGTIKDRAAWCDCCQIHDIAYWQGGTAEERKKADAELRTCVEERTNDKALAETMYLGVRAGGHPALPTWYRWGYGWNYGRRYAPLTDAEKLQVMDRLHEYYIEHPEGYCQERRSANALPVSKRPPQWAQAVPAEHLKNFYKLDDKVYRSAQPHRKGFQELAALGIRNVLSLRDFHADEGAPGLSLYRVQMEAGDIGALKVIAALRIIKNSDGPVLIHCWHGSDRTGLLSAMYRIVFQGWSRESAIDELMHGGYGYHAMYGNIPEFIRAADMEAVKKEVFKP
ncbi:MAG TPA: tyrosine-protein phosphatase [Nitrospirota bacterium]|nr:tyrosine-protein phosphatase [Nitrospirota bacterium]